MRHEHQTPHQFIPQPLFSHALMTTTKKMSRAFDNDHDEIVECVLMLKEAKPQFYKRHFKLVPGKTKNGRDEDVYEMSFAGFLALANMMEEQQYADYLREVQAVFIDLDIILRGPMISVRELSCKVPLEDMAETIKSNLAPLLGGTLSGPQRRRRDFAFALIDRLSP